MKKIAVEIKLVKGKEVVCPVGENAWDFAELIGKKTFSPKQLEIIEGLGFMIKFVKRPTKR